MAKREKQLQLAFRGHGGKRAGGGTQAARRSGRPCTTSKRPKVPRGSAVHVTLRVRREPSVVAQAGASSASSQLGCAGAASAGSSASATTRSSAITCTWSWRAAGKEALGRGMKSVGIRLARAVNRVFGRTGSGAVRALPPARAAHAARGASRARVRAAERAQALAQAQRDRRRPCVLDVASSGAWFDGWKRPPPTAEPKRSPPVAPPRFWLLRKGWRRRGLVDSAEVPGAASA